MTSISLISRATRSLTAPSYLRSPATRSFKTSPAFSDSKQSKNTKMAENNSSNTENPSMLHGHAAYVAGAAKVRPTTRFLRRLAAH